MTTANTASAIHATSTAGAIADIDDPIDLGHPPAPRPTGTAAPTSAFATTARPKATDFAEPRQVAFDAQRGIQDHMKDLEDLVYERLPVVVPAHIRRKLLDDLDANIRAANQTASEIRTALITGT